ncbi:uncharacterized protein LOC126602810 [Malus sylvestris]|uniref:uncharacterized protein LOC126602810 n=1 Tax=Malus sylvestris TaxID=3752 RepID=UPI0021AC3A57|nr:uncharacterized protein LOC126602810 [Malus sylvestris]
MRFSLHRLLPHLHRRAAEIRRQHSLFPHLHRDKLNIVFLSLSLGAAKTVEPKNSPASSLDPPPVRFLHLTRRPVPRLNIVPNNRHRTEQLSHSILRIANITWNIRYAPSAYQTVPKVNENTWSLTQTLYVACLAFRFAAVGHCESGYNNKCIVLYGHHSP